MQPKKVLGIFKILYHFLSPKHDYFRDNCPAMAYIFGNISIPLLTTQHTSHLTDDRVQPRELACVRR